MSCCTNICIPVEIRYIIDTHSGKGNFVLGLSIIISLPAFLNGVVWFTIYLTIYEYRERGCLILSILMNLWTRTSIFIFIFIRKSIIICIIILSLLLTKRDETVALGAKIDWQGRSSMATDFVLPLTLSLAPMKARFWSTYLDSS